MTPTSTTAQGSLFATCALPGCGNPVTWWGETCTDRVAAFGGYLRPAAEGEPALTEHDLIDRDQAAAQAQARQQMIATGATTATAADATATAFAARDEPTRRRNQTCWLCEQRRSCTQMPQGWECDECRDVF